MDFVKHLNVAGVDAKEIPCIVGHGVPTNNTRGAVGSFYMDSDTKKLYKCVQETKEKTGTPVIGTWDGESDTNNLPVVDKVYFNTEMPIEEVFELCLKIVDPITGLGCLAYGDDPQKAVAVIAGKNDEITICIIGSSTTQMFVYNPCNIKQYETDFEGWNPDFNGEYEIGSYLVAPGIVLNRNSGIKTIEDPTICANLISLTPLEEGKIIGGIWEKLTEDSGIVDVEELPTEDINEKVLYRTTVDDTQSYYGYNNNKSSQLVNITDTPEINGDITWDGVVGDKIAWDPASNYYGSEQMVRVSDLVIPEEYLKGNRVLITSSSGGYESTCDSTIWKSDLLENAYHAYDENSSSTMLPRVIYLLKDTIADEQELKAGVYFVYKEVSQLYTVSAVLQNSYTVAPKKLLPTEFKQAFKDSDIVSDAIVDVEELPNENINEKILYRVHQNETYVYYAHKNGVWSQLIDVVTTSETLSADFTWDGTITEGMESIAMSSEDVYYKISDLIVPKEKLLNNTAQMEIIRHNINDNTNKISTSGEAMFVSLGDFTDDLHSVIAAVPTNTCATMPGVMYVCEETVFEGALFKTGIYALRSNGEDTFLYCSKMTLTDPYTETIYNYTLPDNFWSAFETGMTIGGKY